MDTVVGDRNLWHATAQQKNVHHCHANGSDYAQLDSELLNQGTEQLGAVASYTFLLVVLGEY